MVLVDTSIWIRWFRGGISKRPSPEEMDTVVTCSPILQELFQGFDYVPAHSQLRLDLLAVPRLTDPVPVDAYLAAADIYRDIRRRGFTIESSIDCLIAAIAIRHGVPVMHADQDFDTIARFTPLRIAKL
jgi:predicted nucleic acid-binding protein